MSKCTNLYKNDERNLIQISKSHKNLYLSYFQFSKITKITFIILHHFSTIFNKCSDIFNFISIFIIIFKILKNFSKIPRNFLKLSLYNSSKSLNFDFKYNYMSKCINPYKNDERNLSQFSQNHKNSQISYFQFSKITKFTFIIIHHSSSFFNT